MGGKECTEYALCKIMMQIWPLVEYIPKNSINDADLQHWLLRYTAVFVKRVVKVEQNVHPIV